MFKDIKASIKIYHVESVQKNQKKWLDGQMKRLISVRIRDRVSEEKMNEIFKEANKMGYFANDSKTFMKEVPLNQMLNEQIMLRNMFNISLSIN